MAPRGAASWVVLLPVKATTHGKSRIMLPSALRARLAGAMALDTAAAASAAHSVRQVIALVEADADARALAAIPGVTAHRVTARGLNAAIGEGLALSAVAGASPGCAAANGSQDILVYRTEPHVAVLPADLPSLRPDELDAALAAAAAVPFAVVADRQSTGTTLLAAGRAELLAPRYGPGSFAAHLRAGAVPLEVPDTAGLRHDVDVVADLAGVTGARTAALVAATVTGLAGV